MNWCLLMNQKEAPIALKSKPKEEKPLTVSALKSMLFSAGVEDTATPDCLLKMNPVVSGKNFFLNFHGIFHTYSKLCQNYVANCCELLGGILFILSKLCKLLKSSKKRSFFRPSRIVQIASRISEPSVSKAGWFRYLSSMKYMRMRYRRYWWRHFEFFHL